MTWEGGYDRRGPKKHEGQHEGPTQQRRRSVRKQCPDCLELYYNDYAHAEECSGRPVFPPPCGKLIPGYGHGVRYPCSRLQGHEGPCW